MGKNQPSPRFDVPDHKKGLYTPSKKEIEQAKQLDKTACPRRYCWFWRSLEFEFDIPVSKGCEFANDFAHNPRQPAVCARDTGDALDIDWYEPREPHLTQDGFSENHFDNIETYVRVYISTDDYDGDPIEITKLIGIAPSKSWQKGELSAPKSKHKLLQSGWQLFSPLSLSQSVDEHLAALLDVLEANKPNIQKAANLFSMGIYIEEAHQDFPRFRLPPEIIIRIAELGLFLDLRHYEISVDDE